MARRRRRPPKWRFPRSLEKRYAAALPRLVVGPIEDYVKEQILPRLSSIVTSNDVKLGRTDSTRADGWPDEVKVMRRALTFSFQDTQDLVERAASALSVDLYQQNRSEWTKIQNAMIGTTIGRDEPWSGDMLSGWVQQNVSQISKLQQEALTNIEGVISRGMTNGLRVEEIAKDLRGTLGETAKAKRKAKFIARDQIAKLNGAITKERQTAIGVKRYIWRTSDDERVRGDPSGKYPNAKPSHYAMDGKTCRWDDDSVYWDGDRWAKRSSIGGPIGHPGTADYQCRCNAEAILDDVLAGVDNVDIG
jgi:SPP1 gp7 family putative phage head morphogenesis protein